MKKIILTCLIILISVNYAIAKDVVVKVTPAQIITTAHKNSLAEGDYVDFKVTETDAVFHQGDTVTGIVKTIDDNGFAGKEAQVIIGEFKCGEKHLVGEIYLRGSVHKKLNEFVDSQFSGFPVIMRGGEVIAKPNQQEFILHVKE